MTASERIRQARQRTQTTSEMREGDRYTLRAERLYRVVDTTGATVWTGECQACANMIAGSKAGWRVR